MATLARPKPKKTRKAPVRTGVGDAAAGAGGSAAAVPSAVIEAPAVLFNTPVAQLDALEFPVVPNAPLRGAGEAALPSASAGEARERAAAPPSHAVAQVAAEDAVGGEVPACAAAAPAVAEDNVPALRAARGAEHEGVAAMQVPAAAAVAAVVGPTIAAADKVDAFAALRAPAMGTTLQEQHYQAQTAALAEVRPASLPAAIADTASTAAGAAAAAAPAAAAAAATAPAVVAAAAAAAATTPEVASADQVAAVAAELPAEAEEVQAAAQAHSAAEEHSADEEHSATPDEVSEAAEAMRCAYVQCSSEIGEATAVDAGCVDGGGGGGGDAQGDEDPYDARLRRLVLSALQAELVAGTAAQEGRRRRAVCERALRNAWVIRNVERSGEHVCSRPDGGQGTVLRAYAKFSRASLRGGDGGAGSEESDDIDDRGNAVGVGGSSGSGGLASVQLRHSLRSLRSHALDRVPAAAFCRALTRLRVSETIDAAVHAAREGMRAQAEDAPGPAPPAPSMAADALGVLQRLVHVLFWFEQVADAELLDALRTMRDDATAAPAAAAVPTVNCDDLCTEVAESLRLAAGVATTGGPLRAAATATGSSAATDLGAGAEDERWQQVWKRARTRFGIMVRRWLRRAAAVLLQRRRWPHPVAPPPVSALPFALGEMGARSDRLWLLKQLLALPGISRQPRSAFLPLICSGLDSRLGGLGSDPSDAAERDGAVDVCFNEDQEACDRELDQYVRMVQLLVAFRLRAPGPAASTSGKPSRTTARTGDAAPRAASLPTGFSVVNDGAFTAPQPECSSRAQVGEDAWLMLDEAIGHPSTTAVEEQDSDDDLGGDSASHFGDDGGSSGSPAADSARDDAEEADECSPLLLDEGDLVAAFEQFPHAAMCALLFRGVTDGAGADLAGARQTLTVSFGRALRLLQALAGGVAAAAGGGFYHWQQQMQVRRFMAWQGYANLARLLGSASVAVLKAAAAAVATLVGRTAEAVDAPQVDSKAAVALASYASRLLDALSVQTASMLLQSNPSSGRCMAEIGTGVQPLYPAGEGQAAGGQSSSPSSRSTLALCICEFPLSWISSEACWRIFALLLTPSHGVLAAGQDGSTPEEGVAEQATNLWCDVPEGGGVQEQRAGVWQRRRKPSSALNSGGGNTPIAGVSLAPCVRSAREWVQWQHRHGGAAALRHQFVQGCFDIEREVGTNMCEAEHTVAGTAALQRLLALGAVAACCAVDQRRIGQLWQCVHGIASPSDCDGASEGLASCIVDEAFALAFGVNVKLEGGKVAVAGAQAGESEAQWHLRSTLFRAGMDVMVQACEARPKLVSRLLEHLANHLPRSQHLGQSQFSPEQARAAAENRAYRMQAGGRGAEEKAVALAHATMPFVRRLQGPLHDWRPTEADGERLRGWLLAGADTLDEQLARFVLQSLDWEGVPECPTTDAAKGDGASGHCWRGVRAAFHRQVAVMVVEARDMRRTSARPSAPPSKDGGHVGTAEDEIGASPRERAVSAPVGLRPLQSGAAATPSQNDVNRTSWLHGVASGGAAVIGGIGSGMSSGASWLVDGFKGATGQSSSMAEARWDGWCWSLLLRLQFVHRATKTVAGKDAVSACGDGGPFLPLLRIRIEPGTTAYAPAVDVAEHHDAVTLRRLWRACGAPDDSGIAPDGSADDGSEDELGRGPHGTRGWDCLDERKVDPCLALVLLRATHLPRCGRRYWWPLLLLLLRLRLLAALLTVLRDCSPTLAHSNAVYVTAAAGALLQQHSAEHQRRLGQARAHQLPPQLMATLMQGKGPVTSFSAAIGAAAVHGASTVTNAVGGALAGALGAATQLPGAALSVTYYTASSTAQMASTAAAMAAAGGWNLATATLPTLASQAAQLLMAVPLLGWNSAGEERNALPAPPIRHLDARDGRNRAFTADSVDSAHSPRALDRSPSSGAAIAGDTDAVEAGELDEWSLEEDWELDIGDAMDEARDGSGGGAGAAQPDCAASTRVHFAAQLPGRRQTVPTPAAVISPGAEPVLLWQSLLHEQMHERCCAELDASEFAHFARLHANASAEGASWSAALPPPPAPMQWPWPWGQPEALRVRRWRRHSRWPGSKKNRDTVCGTACELARWWLGGLLAVQGWNSVAGCLAAVDAVVREAVEDLARRHRRREIALATFATGEQEQEQEQGQGHAPSAADQGEELAVPSAPPMPDSLAPLERFTPSAPPLPAPSAPPLPTSAHVPPQEVVLRPPPPVAASLSLIEDQLLALSAAAASAACIKPRPAAANGHAPAVSTEFPSSAAPATAARAMEAATAASREAEANPDRPSAVVSLLAPPDGWLYAADPTALVHGGGVGWLAWLSLALEVERERPLWSALGHALASDRVDSGGAAVAGQGAASSTLPLSAVALTERRWLEALLARGIPVNLAGSGVQGARTEAELATKATSYGHSPASFIEGSSAVPLAGRLHPSVHPSPLAQYRIWRLARYCLELSAFAIGGQADSGGEGSDSSALLPLWWQSFFRCYFSHECGVVFGAMLVLNEDASAEVGIPQLAAKLQDMLAQLCEQATIAAAALEATDLMGQRVRRCQDLARLYRAMRLWLSEGDPACWLCAPDQQASGNGVWWAHVHGLAPEYAPERLSQLLADEGVAPAISAAHAVGPRSGWGLDAWEIDGTLGAPLTNHATGGSTSRRVLGSALGSGLWLDLVDPGEAEDREDQGGHEQTPERRCATPTAVVAAAAAAAAKATTAVAQKSATIVSQAPPALPFRTPISAVVDLEAVLNTVAGTEVDDDCGGCGECHHCVGGLSASLVAPIALNPVPTRFSDWLSSRTLPIAAEAHHATQMRMVALDAKLVAAALRLYRSRWATRRINVAGCRCRAIARTTATGNTSGAFCGGVEGCHSIDDIGDEYDGKVAEAGADVGGRHTAVEDLEDVTVEVKVSAWEAEFDDDAWKEILATRAEVEAEAADAAAVGAGVGADNTSGESGEELLALESLRLLSVIEALQQHQRRSRIALAAALDEDAAVTRALALQPAGGAEERQWEWRKREGLRRVLSTRRAIAAVDHVGSIVHARALSLLQPTDRCADAATTAAAAAYSAAGIVDGGDGAAPWLESLDATSLRHLPAVLSYSPAASVLLCSLRRCAKIFPAAPSVLLARMLIAVPKEVSATGARSGSAGIDVGICALVGVPGATAVHAAMRQYDLTTQAPPLMGGQAVDGKSHMLLAPLRAALSVTGALGGVLGSAISSSLVAALGPGKDPKGLEACLSIGSDAPSAAAVSGVRDARLSLLCPLLEPLEQPDALPELFAAAAAAVAAGTGAARRARPWSVASRRMRTAARVAERRARHADATLLHLRNRSGHGNGTSASSASVLRAAASATRAAAGESAQLVPPRTISGGIPPSLALPLLRRFSGSADATGINTVGARVRRWLAMSPPPPPTATTALLATTLRLLAALAKSPSINSSTAAFTRTRAGDEACAPNFETDDLQEDAFDDVETSPRTMVDDDDADCREAEEKVAEAAHALMVAEAADAAAVAEEERDCAEEMAEAAEERTVEVAVASVCEGMLAPLCEAGLAPNFKLVWSALLGEVGTGEDSRAAAEAEAEEEMGVAAELAALAANQVAPGQHGSSHASTGRAAAAVRQDVDACRAAMQSHRPPLPAAAWDAVLGAWGLHLEEQQARRRFAVPFADLAEATALFERLVLRCRSQPPLPCLPVDDTTSPFAAAEPGEPDTSRKHFAIMGGAKDRACPSDVSAAAIAFPFSGYSESSTSEAFCAHGLIEEWAARGVLDRVLQGLALLLDDSDSSSDDSGNARLWQRGMRVYGALLCTLQLEGPATSESERGDRAVLTTYLPPWSSTARGAAVARTCLTAFTHFVRRRLECAAAQSDESAPAASMGPLLLGVWRFLFDVVVPHATACTLSVVGHALAAEGDGGACLPWQHWVADGTALAELRLIVDAAMLPDMRAEGRSTSTHLGALLPMARMLLLRMHWPALITAAAPPPAYAPTPEQEQAALYGYRQKEQTLFVNLLELLQRASLAVGTTCGNSTGELVAAWESSTELQFWRFVGGGICNSSCGTNGSRDTWGGLGGCATAHHGGALSQLAWSHISVEAFEAVADGALLLLRQRNRAAVSVLSDSTTSDAAASAVKGGHVQPWREARALLQLPLPAAPHLSADRLAGASRALWGLLVVSMGCSRAVSFSCAAVTANADMLSDAVLKGAALVSRLRAVAMEVSAAVAAWSGGMSGVAGPGAALEVVPVTSCLLGGSRAGGHMSASLYGDAFEATFDAAAVAAAALHQLHCGSTSTGSRTTPLSAAAARLVDEALLFANIDAVVLRRGRIPLQPLHVSEEDAGSALETSSSSGSGAGIGALVMRAAEGVADGVTRGVRAASVPFDQLGIGDGGDQGARARSCTWAAAAVGVLGRAAARASGQGGGTGIDDDAGAVLAAAALRATRRVAAATLAAAGLRVGEALSNRLALPPRQQLHTGSGALADGHSVFSVQGATDVVGVGSMATLVSCCRSIAAPSSMAAAVELVLDGACAELTARASIWARPSAGGEGSCGTVAQAVRTRWCNELCSALELPQLGSAAFLHACVSCSPPAAEGEDCAALRALVDGASSSSHDEGVEEAVSWYASCSAHEGTSGVAPPAVLTLWVAGLQSQRTASSGAGATQGIAGDRPLVALLVDAVCAASAQTKGLQCLPTAASAAGVSVGAAVASAAARQADLRRLEAKVVFAGVHALALTCAGAVRTMQSGCTEEAERVTQGELERMRVALAAMASNSHGVQGALGSAVDAALGMFGRKFKQHARTSLFSPRFRLAAQALAQLLGALLQLMAQARGAAVIQAAAAKRAATMATGAMEALPTVGSVQLVGVLPPPPPLPPSPQLPVLDVAPPPPLANSLSTPATSGTALVGGGGGGGGAPGPWQHLSLPQDILAGVEMLQAMGSDAGSKQAAQAASLFIALTAAHGTTSGSASLGDAPESVLALCSIDRFVAEVLAPLYAEHESWILLSAVVA